MIQREIFVQNAPSLQNKKNSRKFNFQNFPLEESCVLLTRPISFPMHQNHCQKGDKHDLTPWSHCSNAGFNVKNCSDFGIMCVFSQDLIN